MHLIYWALIMPMQMGPGFPVSIQSLSVAADNYVKLQVKWYSVIIQTWETQNRMMQQF